MKFKIDVYQIKNFLFLLFISYRINAQSSDDCFIKNYIDLVGCAEKNSSEIKIFKQKIRTSLELESLSKQGINPEFEGQTVSKGSEKSETTATLYFTLQLGGKKQALITAAKNESEVAKIDSELNISQIKLRLLLSLYRLTQLKSEISIEDESVKTFSHIIKQFQSKRALSPEQEVSVSVFKLALSDHTLRLNELKQENNLLLHNLRLATGVSESMILKYLPSQKNNWPEITNETELDSLQVQSALAELKLSQSLSDKAEAQAWSDIRIGPSIRTVRDIGFTDTYFGVGVTLPIPLFNLNKGQKSYASQKVKEAELHLDFTRKKTLSDKEKLTQFYKQTVQVILSIISPKEMAQKHRKLENLFFKGLVPSSLVIEAHRQLIDFESRRNLSEMQAIQALGQIYILDNKPIEVIL